MVVTHKLGKLTSKLFCLSNDERSNPLILDELVMNIYDGYYSLYEEDMILMCVCVIVTTHFC